MSVISIEYMANEEMSRNLYGYGLVINFGNRCNVAQIKDKDIFADINDWDMFRNIWICLFN